MSVCSCCGHRGRDVDVIMVCPTCGSIKRAAAGLSKDLEACRQQKAVLERVVENLKEELRKAREASQCQTS